VYQFREILLRPSDEKSHEGSRRNGEDDQLLAEESDDFL